MKEALPHIPAHDYDVWLRVGMALHDAGLGKRAFALWCDWSQTCPEKFDAAVCHKKWDSFSAERESAITVATIIQLAKAHGWNPSRNDPAPWPGDEDAPPEKPAPSRDEEENARMTALEREPATKAHAPRVTLRRPGELVAAPISWRVESIVPNGMLTVLHARDKLGKTLLAWEMADAMLKDHAFLGTFATTPGRVVLALLDDPHDLTVQRRDALGLKDCEALRIVTPLDADLSDPLAFLVEFKSACQEFRPSCIVLDALYQFASPGKDSMNDVSRMRGPMGVFNALAETLPAAVLLIAHDRNDGSDVAGSHVIRASAKALLHLTKPQWSRGEDEEDDGRRILTVTSKMTGEARYLVRLHGVGVWSYLGRGDSARQARMTWAQDRVLTWLKEGGEGTAQEIAKGVRIRREDALAALSVLEEQGLTVSDMRQSGGKGRPKRVYSVPTPGNGAKKEGDGNKNAPPLEPTILAGQSDSIFVPPAWNQAGTKVDPTKATIDGPLSDSEVFLFPNSSFLGKNGNDNCPTCHKPTCTLSPWGWYCRLSPEDKARWDDRQQAFAGDARGAAEDISDEERAAWECGLDPEGGNDR